MSEQSKNSRQFLCARQVVRTNKCVRFLRLTLPPGVHVTQRSPPAAIVSCILTSCQLRWGGSGFDQAFTQTKR